MPARPSKILIHNDTYRLGAQVLSQGTPPYLNQKAITNILSALMAESEQRTLLAALKQDQDQQMLVLQQLHLMMQRFMTACTAAITDDHEAPSSLHPQWQSFIGAVATLLRADQAFLGMHAILSTDYADKDTPDQVIQFIDHLCTTYIDYAESCETVPARVKEYLLTMLDQPSDEHEDFKTDDDAQISLQTFQEEYVPTIKARHLVTEIQYLLDQSGVIPKNLFDIDRAAFSGNYTPYLHNARARMERALTQLQDMLNETDHPIDQEAIDIVEADIHTIAFVIAYRKQHHQLDNDERKKAKPLTPAQKLLKARILEQQLLKAKGNSIDKLRRMQDEYRRNIEQCYAKHQADQQTIAKKSVTIDTQQALLRQKEAALEEAHEEYNSLKKELDAQKQLLAEEKEQYAGELNAMQIDYTCAEHTLSEKLTKTQKQAAALFVTVEKQKATQLQLEKKVLRQQLEQQKTAQHLTETQIANKAIEAIIGKLESTNNELAAQLENMTKANQGEVHKLTQKITTLEAELATKTAELLLSEETIDNQFKQIKSLKKLVQQQVGELTQIKEELSTAQTELVEREQAAKKLIEKCQKQVKELSQLKHQNTDTIAIFNQEAAAKSEEIQELYQCLRQGWLILQDNETTITALTVKQQVAEKRIVKYQQQFQDLKQLYNQGCDLVVDLKQQIGSRDEVIAQSFANLKESRLLALESQALAGELTTANTTLKEHLQAKRQQAKKLQAQCQSLKRILTPLQHAYATTKAEHVRRQQQLAAEELSKAPAKKKKQRAPRVSTHPDAPQPTRSKKPPHAPTKKKKQRAPHKSTCAAAQQPTGSEENTVRVVIHTPTSGSQQTVNCAQRRAKPQRAFGTQMPSANMDDQRMTTTIAV